ARSTAAARRRRVAARADPRGALTCCRLPASRARVGGDTRRWLDPRSVLHVPPPTVLAAPRRLLLTLRVREHEVGHAIEDPAEVVFLDGKVVEVRSWVEKVDGVQGVVANGELDRVHVVTQGVDEGARVGDRPLAKPTLDGAMGDVALVERRLGVVADGHDVLARDADAADVVLPIDELLQDHRLLTGAVVGAQELLERSDDEDV